MNPTLKPISGLVMAITKNLGLGAAKASPSGCAVAPDHPIGATGAILTVTARYEVERTPKHSAPSSAHARY